VMSSIQACIQEVRRAPADFGIGAEEPRIHGCVHVQVAAGESMGQEIVVAALAAAQFVGPVPAIACRAQPGHERDCRGSGEGNARPPQAGGAGRRSARAGLPATTAPAGTSLVTTLPAPTTARSPIVTPQRIVADVPIDAPRLTRVGVTFQSASVCGLPSALAA